MSSPLCSCTSLESLAGPKIRSLFSTESGDSPSLLTSLAVASFSLPSVSNAKVHAQRPTAGVFGIQDGDGDIGARREVFIQAFEASALPHPARRAIDVSNSSLDSQGGRVKNLPTRLARRGSAPKGAGSEKTPPRCNRALESAPSGTALRRKPWSQTRPPGTECLTVFCSPQ